MQEDLNLQGQDYNVALTVFFVSYALLEVPSNIILKMMRPSHWVAIMMFGVCRPQIFSGCFNVVDRIVGTGYDSDGNRQVV